MPYDPNEIKYGWYSPTADSKTGHAVYLDMNGKEVLITEITRPPAEKPSKHEDLAFVGQVKTFVRAEWHRPPYTKIFAQ